MKKSYKYNIQKSKNELDTEYLDELGYNGWILCSVVQINPSLKNGEYNWIYYFAKAID